MRSGSMKRESCLSKGVGVDGKRNGRHLESTSVFCGSDGKGSGCCRPMRLSARLCSSGREYPGETN